VAGRLVAKNSGSYFCGSKFDILLFCGSKKLKKASIFQESIF
jgi:hypothetical protein